MGKRKCTKSPAKSVTMTLQLSTCCRVFVIQVKDHKGEMQGTLVLDAEGIRYKRPNQKKPAERRISWQNLGRLMDISLAVGTP